MTTTASAVIIGGGATGTSPAFHPAQRRLHDVVLLEKDFIASGPTGRSSACVRPDAVFLAPAQRRTFSLRRSYVESVARKGARHGQARRSVS